MPNRILKESICSSENINALTPEQEVFFYRLLVNCDDFGRMDARASILLSRCFPLMYGEKSAADIENYLDALEKNNLIKLYHSAGRPYLQMTKWEKHQTIRNKKSKYPSIESACKQVQANVPVIQSNPKPIQSDILPDTVPVSDSIIEIILNDNSMYSVERTQFEEWQSLYPKVDIMQELRNMRGWADANPTKRKTKNGIKRFINSWLAKEQDKGGASTTGGVKPTAFSNFKQTDYDFSAIEKRALGKK